MKHSQLDQQNTKQPNPAPETKRKHTLSIALGVSLLLIASAVLFVKHKELESAIAEQEERASKLREFDVRMQPIFDFMDLYLKTRGQIDVSTLPLDVCIKVREAGNQTISWLKSSQRKTIHEAFLFYQDRHDYVFRDKYDSAINSDRSDFVRTRDGYMEARLALTRRCKKDTKE